MNEEEDDIVPDPPRWDLAKIAVFLSIGSGVLLAIVFVTIGLVDVFYEENTRERTKLLLTLVMLLLAGLTVLMLAFLLSVVAWVQGNGQRKNAVMGVVISVVLGLGSALLLMVR